MRIRLAKKSDYQKLMKLYNDFVQEDRYSKHNNDSFKKVLKDPQAFIILAEKNKNIVGFITFSLRNVVRYPKPIIEVEEFYVLPEQRRQGIGKKLTQYVLDFAKKNKCQYVFLGSAKERKPAHKFYQALEFSEYAFHYRLKIS